jgi:hypothetical protein
MSLGSAMRAVSGRRVLLASRSFLRCRIGCICKLEWGGRRQAITSIASFLLMRGRRRRMCPRSSADSWITVDGEKRRRRPSAGTPEGVPADGCGIREVEIRFLNYSKWRALGPPQAQFVSAMWISARGFGYRASCHPLSVLIIIIVSSH